MQYKTTNALTIFAVICLDLLAGMEFDLFVPGFTQLQQHFHLTAFWVEALLAVNFIGYCISLFVVGDLADRFGRKPVILLGLSSFIIGSILCVAIDCYPFILLGRLLQGVGIAAPTILSFLIIADNYPMAQQQFWLAMLNGAMNIAVAVAPVIGSFITLYYGWHGNFIALLIISLLTLAMTLFFIPSYSLPKQQSTTWLKGCKSIFQSKLLLLLMATQIVMFVPYWIFVGVTPLLYIKNFHVSFATFGFYQGVLAFSFAIGSILFGLVITHYSSQKWLTISLLIFIAAILMIGWLVITNNQHPLMITLSMLIFDIGQIAPNTILYPRCLELLPQAKAKMTALIQGSRLVLCALGLEIAGYFDQGTFQSTGIIIILFVAMVVVMLYVTIKVAGSLFRLDQTR